MCCGKSSQKNKRKSASRVIKRKPATVDPKPNVEEEKK